MHNILITGGTVIDGTGTPGRPLDVAIDGAKISGLYKHSEAKATMAIDARGKIVCPGFIDIHSHSELMLLCNPLAESKIRQGVTTELVGNCGMSPAPAFGVAREALASLAQPLDVEVDWATMDEYLLRLANLRTSLNVAVLVGAGTLRHCVIGNKDVKASEEQLFEMRGLLAESMLQGAYGLSSGLIYAPGCYSTTEELTALASTASSFGGLYTSHIRGEGRTLVDAVQEAISIGRNAPTRVQISHHKACGKSCWGLVNRTIGMIEDARAEGVDVAFDVYPYTASCTSLETILPPWVREGRNDEILARIVDPATRKRIVEEFKAPSNYWEDTVAETGWENINVIGLRTQAYTRFENKSVAQIASETGKPPEDVALDIIADENLMPYAVFHEISEDDVMKVISHPLASIGSDGEAEAPYGPTGKHATHPRAYGTFPRAIKRFVLEKRLVPLEEMIRKMTSWPAERIGLADRGVLAEGMAADIVVFDPATISDRATFDDSHAYPVGIDRVIVNGALTISDGEHTKERAGIVLRHAPRVS
jgi:N-acyl-D-amino-acid deacylase